MAINPSDGSCKRLIASQLRMFPICCQNARCKDLYCLNSLRIKVGRAGGIRTHETKSGIVATRNP